MPLSRRAEENGANMDISCNNACNVGKVKIIEGKRRVNRFYIN
jgi:hypothetical protein